jgi:glycosyltransferase involved in cell wall biosynthesis
MLISIVTPTYNELDNIDLCVSAVKNLMNNELSHYDYEHIFIDNRSDDGTIQKLAEAAKDDKKVKVIVNSKNIGASKSVFRALRFTKGELIVPMVAADLQDPPTVISQFVSEWEKGFKLVFGQRTNRRESLIMRTTRSLYYKIIRAMADSEIPLNAGEFLLVDRQVLNTLLDTNDKNPYVRGLFAQTGIEASYVPYNWHVRTNGKSKATLLNMVDLAVNGLISTSRIPARVALISGFLLSCAGLILGIVTAISKFLGLLEAAPGIPTLVTAVFVLGGAQLFFLGLIGEYVLSIHSQVKPEPEAYSIIEINFLK